MLVDKHNERSTMETTEIKACEAVNISDFVQKVHVARLWVVRQKAELATAQVALEQTPEYQEVKRITELVTAANKGIETYETALRIKALDIYNHTSNKTPVPGVSIKVGKHFSYDSSEAIVWCKEHVPYLVKEILDTKGFLKIAEVFPGAPVEVSEDPKVFIDSDLSKILESTTTR